MLAVAVPLLALAGPAVALSPDTFEPGMPALESPPGPLVLGGVALIPYPRTCSRVDRTGEHEVIYEVDWMRVFMPAGSGLALDHPVYAEVSDPRMDSLEAGVAVERALKADGWTVGKAQIFPGGGGRWPYTKGDRRVVLTNHPNPDLGWSLELVMEADKQEICPRHGPVVSSVALELAELVRAHGVRLREPTLDDLDLVSQLMSVQGLDLHEVAEWIAYGTQAIDNGPMAGAKAPWWQLMDVGRRADRTELLPGAVSAAFVDERDWAWEQRPVSCVDELTSNLGDGGWPKVLREDPALPLNTSGTIHGQARFRLTVNTEGRVVGVEAAHEHITRRKKHLATIEAFHDCMARVLAGVELPAASQTRTGDVVVDHKGGVSAP